MASKMLIDASHPEETRVVVIRGNRIEEFDFESAARRQLKGNIYLAKVTRVEPSLQAAFVEYGGNRHGFLAFSEIHPDYYQIPLADRLALLQEEEEEHRDHDDDDNGNGNGQNRDERRSRGALTAAQEPAEDADSEAAEAGQDTGEPAPGWPDEGHAAEEQAAGAGDEPEDGDEADAGESDAGDADVGNDHDDDDDEGGEGGETPRSQPLAATHNDDRLEEEVSTEDGEAQDEAADAASDEEPAYEAGDEDGAPAEAAQSSEGEAKASAEDDDTIEVSAPVPRVKHGVPGDMGDGVEDVEEDPENQKVESVGAEDAMEEVPQRRRKPQRRQYKIQEVIKRRQVILVQVVKEERGNKGAALTTYLSLAGRYCVLMPNTARGGGISRKITDSGDRRRLKEVAKEIEVPQGMGLIVRTAGAQRTKSEIKRDYDYLLRLWESVRDLTLKSTAPALVYEEGSLVKRAIRDLYTKDVDEVMVEGDAAYREAKDFMKMLMPSHAKNVKAYKDTRPLFSRYQAESQLDGLYSPTVTLPSGGYMVINQTEALVSVDINSGKATREHNIEDTAYRTNLEASDEIARQLRLRDLAGLVVIDFIDMEEKRNNRNVERRLKEALKHDRARIQVGRISHFGLLEMSRQRLRPGLLEGSSRTCPHCEGRGVVRSISSCGLSVLRAIEEHLIARKPENLTVKCPREIAFYILNEKRDNLLNIETTYGISIFVTPSDELKGSQAVIERAGERNIPPRKVQALPVRIDSAFAEEEDEEVAEETAEAEETEAEAETAEAGGEAAQGQQGDKPESGRKRRRRRGRRGGRSKDDQPAQAQGSDDVPGLGEQPDVDDGADDTPESEASSEPQAEAVAGSSETADDDGEQPAEAATGDAAESRDSKPRRDRHRERKPRGKSAQPAEPSGEPQPAVEDAPAETVPEPTAVAAMPAAQAPAAAVTEAVAEAPAEPPRRWQPPAPTVAAEATERKTGWWRRK
jgi:ribonuclease E